jgi:hypothetical protein
MAVLWVYTDYVPSSVASCRSWLYPEQLNPVHTPTSYFLKIHLNIILPPMPGSPQWSLSLRLSGYQYSNNNLSLFHLSHELHSRVPNDIESVPIIAVTSKAIINVNIARYARKLRPTWNATSS